MAYKDKDRQREAQREWVRQKRKGSTEKGSTKQGSTKSVTSFTDLPNTETIPPVEQVRYKLPDITVTKPERTAQGNIRVSKPGDADYEPQCETTGAFIEGRDKRPETGKRGKDIKVFADLPPHVQQTIDMMSTTDGKLEQTIKANRTAIAINYQHQFPDRYHSTGVV